MNIERMLTGIAALLVFLIAGAYATGLQHTLPMFASPTESQAALEAGGQNAAVGRESLADPAASNLDNGQDLATYQMSLPHYAPRDDSCAGATGDLGDRQALADYQAGLHSPVDVGARQSAACGLSRTGAPDP